MSNKQYCKKNLQITGKVRYFYSDSLKGYFNIIW